MIFGIFKIIGVVIFLYLVWRNLREDYKENLLIDYSWQSVLVTLAGGRLAYGLIHWGVWNDRLIDWLSLWQKPGFSYVGGLISLLAITIWYCKNNDWKLWPFLESITELVYLSLLFFMIGDKSWVNGGVMLFGYFLAKFVGTKYRSFVWYRSGKKGFVFFFVNIVIGLILAMLSWWLKNGAIMMIVYLGLSLISVVGLVMLANDEN